MLLFVLAIFTIVCFYNFYWKRRNLPPGPIPLPIIGNVFQIDMEDRNVEQYKKWRAQYGNVMTIWLGEEPNILVTSHELMVKYFVKQGDNFSDRILPKSFVDIRGGAYGIVPTSEHIWRESRRFALTTLRDFGLGKNQMEERVLTEVDCLIHKVDSILSTQDEIDLCKYTDIAVGSVINTVINGYRFTIHDREPEFYNMKQHTTTFFRSVGNPISRVIMKFPLLIKYWTYKNPVQTGMKAVRDIFAFIEARIAEHTDVDYTEEFQPRDFIDAFLIERARREKKGDFLFSDIQLKNCCFDLWFAGQETTSSCLQWIFAHMIHYRHVQEKIQMELDEVIGSDRLITTTDRAALHYTNAAIMESFRCANLLLLNVPHATSTDVEVEGYKLPKNTTIFPQLGMLLRDEKAFPDPNSFKPERFLDKNGHFKNIDEMLPFSLGKRQCLGEGLARMELFLFTANILNRYNVYSGKNPPAMQKISPGAMGHKQYSCVMTKRI